MELLGLSRPKSHLSNENDRGALTVMPKKPSPSDSAGPMRMQPAEHGPVPEQMLPTMPCASGEANGQTKTPAPAKKQRTRAEAVRAALARIMLRSSLKKQRDAQKR
jgi:hypothetical protein